MGIQGEVKAISSKNNSVLISYTDPETEEVTESWFQLGEKVKISYLKKGSCEFNAVQTDEGMEVTFCKCTGTGESKPAFKSGGFPKAKSTSNPFKPADNYESNDEMKRMSALKAASRIYEGTGKEEDFKRLTNDVGFFIEQGHWKAKGEPVEKEMGEY